MQGLQWRSPATSFRITGLDSAQFSHLFGLSEAALAAQGVQRCAVTAPVGFADRVELRDVAPGQSVLLLNYTHQPANNAYRASHAIFVREGAAAAYDEVDLVPEVMRLRMISLRGFDAADMMVAAELVDGRDLTEVIEQMLWQSDVSYLQAHYAQRGCYAARVVRG